MTDNLETPDASPPPAERAAVPPPEGGIWQLGQFQILDKIGEGGMGAVYRGIQVSLHRPVAIKLLPETLAQNQSFIERFHREARAAAALNHPNIIQVYDAGEQDGIHYFAMELVDGETLSNKVERDGPMHESEAIAVAMCVSAALQHAWTKARLIHRDIKPDNIIVTTDGMVKVCDLGLAKSVGQDSNLTVSGTMMGTPHYIAPEQACGEAEVDTRADIYSLGSSLFFLLTGKPPFHADSSMAVMYKHVNEPLPDPRKLNPKLSNSVVRVLKKMTAKDPADRYQDMLELYNDLERVYQGLAPTGVVRAPDSPEARLRRMRRWLRLWSVLGVTGICALAVIGVGIWKTQQQHHTATQQRPASAKNKTSARTTPSIPAPSSTPIAVAPPAIPGFLLKKHQAETRERVRELLKQQQLDATLRTEEQRKADEEAERQRAAIRAASGAQLAAEEAYLSFLNLWKPLIAAHNYARAGEVAQNAMDSPKYAPIKGRLELHAALGDALKTLDDKFQQALPALKGKQLTLGGFTGAVVVEAAGVTLDTRPGAGRTFSFATMRIEDRLPLMMAALGPGDPNTLVSAGLLSLTEGRTEWTRDYFEKARLSDKTGDAKAVTNRFEPLCEAIERAPAEVAAVAALDEIQKLITAGKWEDASAKIAVAGKQFADTTIMKLSAERLQEMREAVIAAESGPQEAQAELALNQLRQDIEGRKWNHAAKTLAVLDQRFARTEVVKNSRDLADWRKQVNTHSTTGGTGALSWPTLRHQLAMKPGVTIHQVSNRGGKMKPGLLSETLAKARNGDGIELDEGYYSWRSAPAGLKNISIFAKPGTVPVIYATSNWGDGLGVHLTASNGCWRFEGVILTGPRAGQGTNKTVELSTPITLDRGASVVFNQCIILWRRAMQALPPMIRCGPGSEVTLHNCVLSANHGFELSGAQHIRMDHCTCAVGSLFWLGTPRPAAKACDVDLVNSVVLADAESGLVGDEKSERLAHAVLPSDVGKRLDLSAVHHTVVMLHASGLMQPWSDELEKPSKKANFVTLTTDEPPLAALMDRAQLDYRLKSDCPAVHMADDGLAVGIRWTETFSQSVASGMLHFRELGTRGRNAAP